MFVLFPCLAGAAELAPLQPPVCPEYKEICVQADRTGGIDLNNGVAHLEGNVLGVMKSKELTFRADTLRAYRNDQDEWVRLVLDLNVVFSQPDQRARADHAILEQVKTVLFGSVYLKRPKMTVESHQVLFEEDPRRSVIEGSRDKPLRIEFLSKAPARVPAQTENSPAGGNGAVQTVVANEIMETTWVFAQKAVLEETLGRADISGGVRIRQKLRELNLTAESVSLFFTEDNELDSFRAEGNVVVLQPDRKLQADTAISQNNMETILLLGNTKVAHTGQFDISADRMEVYTQVDRGLVKSSNQQKPITLTMDLGANSPYLLNAQRVEILAQQGIPQDTLAKLSPLVDQDFKIRSMYISRLKELMSPEESERYLETIVRHSR